MNKYRRFLCLCCVMGSSLFGAQDVNEEVSKLVESNNTFAFQLYHTIAEGDENVCFSPYSISSALAMTYAGAEGETKDQMGQVLGFAKLEDVHAAFASLEPSLAADYTHGSDELHLYMANSLWIQKQANVLPKFLEIMTNDYHASVNTVDFVKQTDQARQQINDWIAKKTFGKIENLINPDDLTKATRLVLTCASYLKASWSEVFDKKQTEDGLFYKSAKETVSVPMMKNTARFNLLEEENFALLELPYVQPQDGPQLSMLIFLPKKSSDVHQIENLISAETTKKWVSGLQEKRVSVILPRFKILDRFDLNDALSKLGMPVAFSNKADFSGMNGATDLKIGKVLHKAFIAVNEEGTEAAAATAVIMKMKAAPNYEKPTEFRADHPFIYMIYEKKSGTILFLGRVFDPTTGAGSR